jgi:hypothetical protein
MSQLILRPNANGSTIQLSKYPIISSNYQCVDEATSDGDSSYVYSSAGGYDFYGVPNHSTETGVIDSVKVYVVARKTAIGDTVRSYPGVYTHSTAYWGDYKNLGTSYSENSYTWTTNPNTGSAWTWSEIDSMEIGVKLSTDNPGVNVPRCTQVWVEVDYTDVVAKTSSDTGSGTDSKTGYPSVAHTRSESGSGTESCGSRDLCLTCEFGLGTDAKVNYPAVSHARSDAGIGTESDTSVITCTIASGTVSSDLTNYPYCMIIKASSGLGSTDLTNIFDVLGSNKLKIKAWQGSTQCYIEIATWDTTNKYAELYIRIPSITASGNTTFTLEYNPDWPDNTAYVGATGSTPAMAVWDSNFVAVYHMNDASTTTIADSTSNANTGTKKAIGEPVEVTGTVGKAQSFDGSNDYIDCGNGASLNITDAITIEAWVKPKAIQTYYAGIFGQLSGSIENAGLLNYDHYWSGFIRTASGCFNVSDSVPFSAYDGNTWVHFITTYDGETLRFYKNGDNIATNTTSSGAMGNVTIKKTIGYHNGYPFNGLISEVRISSVARSASWVAATNSNITNTYTTYSTPEGKPGEVTDFTVTASGNNLVLSWTKGTLSTDTVIVRSELQPPASISDGIIVYDGEGSTYTDLGANTDVTPYYYSVWAKTVFDDGTFYSDTAVSTTAGGVGMTLTGNAIWFIGLAAISLAFTAMGYAFRRWPLSMAGGLGWFLTAVFAYGQSSGGWDIYMGIFWLGIAMTFAASFEPLIMPQTKKEEEQIETDYDEDDEEDDDEEFELARHQISRGKRDLMALGNIEGKQNRPITKDQREAFQFARDGVIARRKNH